MLLVGFSSSKENELETYSNSFSFNRRFVRKVYSTRMMLYRYRDRRFRQRGVRDDLHDCPRRNSLHRPSEAAEVISGHHRRVSGQPCNHCRRLPHSPIQRPLDRCDDAPDWHRHQCHRRGGHQTSYLFATKAQLLCIPFWSWDLTLGEENAKPFTIMVGYHT